MYYFYTFVEFVDFSNLSKTNLADLSILSTNEVLDKNAYSNHEAPVFSPGFKVSGKAMVIYVGKHEASKNDTFCLV